MGLARGACGMGLARGACAWGLRRGGYATCPGMLMQGLVQKLSPSDLHLGWPPQFCLRAEEPGRETGPAAMGHHSWGAEYLMGATPPGRILHRALHFAQSSAWKRLELACRTRVPPPLLSATLLDFLLLRQLIRGACRSAR